MTTDECVIDVELFKMISSDEEFKNITECLQNKIKCSEFTINDYDECCCFIDILKAVKNSHCKLGVNNSILKDYIEGMKKYPRDIQEMFRAISSTKPNFKQIDEIDSRDTEHFKGTPLEPKIDYIAVANALDPKMIVSTMRSIEHEYSLHYDKLDMLGVNCLPSCKAKDEILFK